MSQSVENTTEFEEDFDDTPENEDESFVDMVKGSKTIVSTLMRALESAKKRRANADAKVKQLERILRQFKVSK